MIQCPECEKEIADDSAHCGYCGAKIEAGGGMKTIMGFAAVTGETLRQAAEEAKAARKAAEEAANPPTQPDPATPSPAPGDGFDDAPTEMMSAVKHAPSAAASPGKPTLPSLPQKPALPPLQQPASPVSQPPATEPPVTQQPAAQQPATQQPAKSLDPWATTPDDNFSFDDGNDFSFDDSPPGSGDFSMSSSPSAPTQQEPATAPPALDPFTDTDPALRAAANKAPAPLPARNLAEATVPEQLALGAPLPTSTSDVDGPSELGSGKMGIVPAQSTLPEKKSNKTALIVVGAVGGVFVLCCFMWIVLNFVLPLIAGILAG